MKEETKSVLGIAYLYTTITAICAIISYVFTLFYSSIDKYSITACLLLFGFYAVIWFVLYKLNKKQNQGFGDIFKDNTVRKTTGVLITINVLISLLVAIPAVTNAISQIISNNIDASVIPTIISFAFILFQILIGVYLLKYTRKDNGQYITKTVIGSAYLFTSITTAFALVRAVLLSIIYHDTLNEYFFLRFVPLAAILVVLFILNKKQDQSFVSAFQDNTVRKSTGVLILISGLISLSNEINSVINTIWLTGFLGRSDFHTAQSIMSNIICFVIVVIQILLGIYMLKLYKRKTGEQNIVQ